MTEDGRSRLKWHLTLQVWHGPLKHVSVQKGLSETGLHTAPSYTCTIALCTLYSRALCTLYSRALCTFCQKTSVFWPACGQLSYVLLFALFLVRQ
ncbi:unnamed protein product [Boreogadus saida]